MVAMDPVCHTLVGATLAQAGLRDRSRLATAALVIGANLPDVDGITYLLGDSLLWRRGWTHGVLALVVWPFVLTAGLMAWSRWRPGHRDRPPPRPVTLLWISALAVLTHPTLDFLNNYGLRWLMPFSNRWFYGDALFIADPWLWLALTVGGGASWRLGRRQPRTARWHVPARAALAAAVVYVIAMTTLAVSARGLVREQFQARHVPIVGTPMVAPVFADVSRRYVVADDGRRYHVTGFDWWPAVSLDATSRIIAHDADHPAIARARTDPGIRHFLQWSRFPFFTVAADGDGYVVTVEDARYAPPAGASWASASVRVPREAARHGTGAAEVGTLARPPLHGMMWIVAAWCQPSES